MYKRRKGVFKRAKTGFSIQKKLDTQKAAKK
jgi:hypothetical protein